MNEKQEEETAARAFGRRLRKTLRAKGVSNAELARRIKVSPNAVSAWTTGRSAPEYKHLIRIIQTLDASPAELLSDAAHPSPVSPSDQLILRLAGFQLTNRVRDLSAIGNGVLITLKQIDERAAEINTPSDER